MDGNTPDARSLIDGQAAVQARRQARQASLVTIMLIWLILGAFLFYITEGWDPLQTTVFDLGILTGSGYGHIAPGTPAGKISAAVWIVAGLGVFGAIVGQILDNLVEAETSFVGDSCKTPEESDSLHEQRVAARWSSFLMGSSLLGAGYLLALLVFTLYFRERFVDAIYMSSVILSGLDSICGLDGVRCSGGWKSSKAGEVFALLTAMVWYIVFYPLLGYAIVSIASCFGVDTSPVLSQIKDMNKDRFARMDMDGDGKIKRSEFLRDRLIQGKLCTPQQVDSILDNFDQLDKDGNGYLDKKDLA
mmetsp:Transcript_56181/g.100080  ORF Transcript_56181/g.100080 Transcript_56181/m.100080 type:complete len:304 (+) Transcript_56181:63-974(+)